MTMSIVETFTLLASLATAAGVIIAAYQIRISRIESVSQFEDSFAKEYREVASQMPTLALLGVELTEDEKAKHFDELFRYFDLSNEQTFLRQTGRIRKSTWIFWRDGMKSNLEKPAFHWAWQKIEETGTKEFSELRRLIASRFTEDPREWKKRGKRAT